MITQSNFVFHPLVVRTTQFDPEDTIFLGELMKLKPTDFGTLVTFEKNAEGQYVSPDGRHSYCYTRDMLLSTCTHICVTGHTNQMIDGVNVHCEPGDGGWFYLPVDILTSPITSSVPSSFVSIFITSTNYFLHNRTMHSVKQNETYQLEPPPEGWTRYFCVIKGDVLVNGAVSFSGPSAAYVKNPATVTSVTDSISIIIDLPPQ